MLSSLMDVYYVILNDTICCSGIEYLLLIVVDVLNVLAVQ